MFNNQNDVLRKEHTHAVNNTSLPSSVHFPRARDTTATTNTRKLKPMTM